jgi:23S rRNA pseudouridine2605 synthase
MRLHRYIAQSGITSRRKAEELIREGRVMVNDSVVVEMGTKVEPGDHVTVDGETIAALEHQTVMLNKPKGVVTTLDDERGRQTVVSLLPPSLQGLKPVGRLDKDTEGLLLLTTDGELAARLTHAKFGVEKEYVATVEGRPTDATLDKLRRGVFVDGRRTAPAQFKLISFDERRQITTLNIVLHEGRKRQIRLMCLYSGHPVRTLRRVRIGNLLLKGMAPGEARLVPKKDLDRLKSMVGL